MKGTLAEPPPPLFKLPLVRILEGDNRPLLSNCILYLPLLSILMFDMIRQVPYFFFYNVFI